MKKYVNGSIGIFKMTSGLFLGDFIKLIYFPIVYFKSYLLGCVTYLLSSLEYFFIFDVFLYRFKKIARSPGVYCQIVNFFFELNMTLLILPSKKKIYLNCYNLCTIGRSANLFFKYSILGNSKWLHLTKKKPTVRGVAKNPVDHPHGGRTKTVKPEVSPWGWVTKYSH